MGRDFFGDCLFWVFICLGEIFLECVVDLPVCFVSLFEGVVEWSGSLIFEGCKIKSKCLVWGLEAGRVLKCYEKMKFRIWEKFVWGMQSRAHPHPAFFLYLPAFPAILQPFNFHFCHK